MPHTASRYLILFVLAISLHNCIYWGKSNHREKESDANAEYKAGLKALNGQDLIYAEIHFQNALARQENFAPAWEGLARIQLRKDQPLLAERYLERAIRADQNWVPAYILKSRLLLKNEDYDLAREELYLAQKRIKKHRLKSFQAQIQPLLAETCFGLGNYATAVHHFREALKQNPDDGRLQKRLEQATLYSQLLKDKSRRLKDVVRTSEIKRGDLALLMRHFLISKSAGSIPIENQIADLPQDPELAESIRLCCAAHYLPVLPDQTFHPEDKVDRAEMALFIEQILKRKYPFKVPADLQQANDVEPFQPFSRAVRLVLALKLMQWDENLNFHPYKITSGGEALIIIHRLQQFLELPVFPAYLLRN